MLKKVIHIRIPLAVLYAVAGVVLVAVLLWMTNGITNLRLMSIRPDQIESVTIYMQYDGRQATLKPEDARILAEALPKVVLEGDSVRLLHAETRDPQFRVQLKNGYSFDISCYDGYYIFNGRGYVAKNTELAYRQIAVLYENCYNRSYFPEEGGA